MTFDEFKRLAIVCAKINVSAQGANPDDFDFEFVKSLGDGKAEVTVQTKRPEPMTHIVVKINCDTSVLNS